MKLFAARATLFCVAVAYLWASSLEITHPMAKFVNVIVFVAFVLAANHFIGKFLVRKG
tara:strand:- start:791 stop:964 length:174 start_codon:yes stop_codon:yes gene_type:complete